MSGRHEHYCARLDAPETPATPGATVMSHGGTDARLVSHSEGSANVATSSGSERWSFGAEQADDATAAGVAGARLQHGQDELDAVRSITQRMNGLLYRCRNDDDFTMVHLVGSVQRLTGYAPQRLLVGGGVSYASLIHPEDAAAVDAAIEQAIDAGSGWVVDYRLRRSDGSEVWVNEVGGAVHDAAGDLQWLEGIVLDASDRKREEQRRRALAEDVAQRSTDILAETRRILAVLRRLTLLALNARVESARAGEAGLGFAVVAREMQELSDTTAQSAGTITELMGRLQALLDDAGEAS